jgi:putative hydrolase of the HAD superfamily
MEHITAIGFDLFDTLITLKNLGFKDAMDRLVRELQGQGFPVVAETFLPIYRETASGFMSRAHDEGRETHNRFWISSALQQLGYDVEPDDKRIAHVVDAYFSAFIDHAVLLPDTLPTLHILKRRYRLGLLSNFTHAPVVYQLLKRFGLGDVLDIQLVSGVLGYRKPKPLVFNILAEQFGVPPAQIAFVGDNLKADIAGAKEAGLWPIHTTYALHYNTMQSGGVVAAQSGDDPDPPLWSRPLSEGHERPATDVSLIQSWDDLLRLFNLSE